MRANDLEDRDEGAHRVDRVDRDDRTEATAPEERAPLVAVGNYPTPLDGAVDRARLRAEGLDAVLFDTEMATNWVYTNALGGVRLMVPRDEEAAARRILAAPVEAASGAEPDAGDLIAPDAPETWCPACHARDVETPDEPPRGRWARWFNPGAARRCRACGHLWRA